MASVQGLSQLNEQTLVPAWVEALATSMTAIAAIIALIAAFRAAAYTKRLLAIESDREERALRESEGRQAYQVDAWEERLPPTHFGTLGALVVRLVNSSNVAVYDIAIDWYDHDLRAIRAGSRLPILKPGHQDVLLPEELSWPEADDAPGLSVEPISGWPFTMSFRDRSGLYWQRGFNGSLTRLPKKTGTSSHIDSQLT